MRCSDFNIGGAVVLEFSKIKIKNKSSMINTGSITIGTVNSFSDERRQRQAWFVISIPNQPAFRQAIALSSSSYSMNEMTITWTLPAAVLLEDIEKVDIVYTASRVAIFDYWQIVEFIFEVNDSETGRRVIFRNDSVNFFFYSSGTWSTGVLPTFTLIVITVVDEFNLPVVGANVFIDANSIGITNQQGQINPAGMLSGNEIIVARKLVYEQGSHLSNHSIDSSQNWNYRVHLTNMEIDENGVCHPNVIRSGAAITLPISKSNTLIGVNLILSIEWDATIEELRFFEELLRNCSAFLFNATDGQFFIEITQIFDMAFHFWGDADFRCYTNWNYHANVPNVTGGFLGWHILGSAMCMSRSDDFNAYIHEFGHYGLDLSDEYNDNDKNIECSGNLGSPNSPFREDQPKSSCIMWDERRTFKICSSHRDNPHVRGTRQGDQSCWDKLASRYNHSDRWRIKTPSERGNIPGRIVFQNGQPVSGPFISTNFSTVNQDLPNLIGILTLTVSNNAGSFIRGVEVYTSTTYVGSYGWSSERWLHQGKTDSLGRIRIAGIHSGDRVRLEIYSAIFLTSVFEQVLPIDMVGVTNINVIIP